VSTLLALRLITYLLVGVGVAALLLAGLLDPLGGVILTLALIGSWAIDQVRDRMPVRSIFGWALVTTAAFAIGIDLLYLAQSLLDGMVHLLLFLILLRLFRRRSLKDLRDAGFLSFFMLVAASAVTFNVSFLFVFVAFLVLGTWMLILHHLAGESERAKMGAAEFTTGGIGPGSPLFRMSLVAAAGTFALAGVMFFVIPRVGQATLPFRAELGRRISGFSERVELGSYGEIEADQTVVMRVRFPDSIPEPFRLPNLRWRGLAFDRFDGRVWESGARQRTLLRREASGDFALATPRGTGPIVRQEILLDPIGSDAVFAAPKALRIETSAGAVGLDDMGSIVLPTVSTRLQYSVDSELEQTPPRGLRAGAWPVEGPPRGPVRFLELPPLPERIRTLARDVAAGSHSPYEAALRLSQYLSSDRFTYTLVLKQQTALDPLEEFLFVRRSGNCEYFAASLAVMLRSVGIPSRVVGGFQRGEWNPYGRYFMVRMKDAHSWVEAFFDGAGWVTLDPSPRAAAEEALGGPSTWMLYVDAVRMRWYRYVVNWSLRDQVSVAVSMHRGALEWRGGLVGWRDWVAGLPRGVVVAAIVAFLVVAWMLWRHGPRAGGRATSATVPRFYVRALRLLARRGFRRAPTETAREFSRRVEEEAPAAAGALARLTAAYERCRFGAGALSPEEAAAVEASIAALRGR
jgi:transglutaminase-like putative cysteine protease